MTAMPDAYEIDPAQNAPRPALPAKGLTGRQHEVLGVIVKHLTEKGYAPTLREIGAAVLILSTNGVNDHLRALERKGFIARDTMLSRGMRLLEPTFALFPNAPRAGRPTAASSASEAHGAVVVPQIHIYDALFPKHIMATIHRPSCSPRAAWGFVIHSHSLRGRGFMAEDWLFVDDRPFQLATGQLVVVRFDDQAMARFVELRGPAADVALVTNTEVGGTFSVPRKHLQEHILGLVVGMYRPMGARVSVEDTPYHSASSGSASEMPNRLS